MSDTAQQPNTDAASKKKAAPVIVRLDRSRDFATVHGERAPGDKHAAVHFYQDGLPFDASGECIEDHSDLDSDTRDTAHNKRAVGLQTILERKKKKQAKLDAARAANPDGAGDEDEDDDLTIDDVNLAEWAKGTSLYPWNLVTQAIAGRYKKRVTSKADALWLLIDEKVVAESELSPAHKKVVG